MHPVSETQALSPSDARRRWFGLLFLILAGGMLIWGLTVLDPHLRGLGFVCYWSACLVFTALAFGVAWCDLRVIRRRQRAQRRELLDRTVASVREQVEAARQSRRRVSGRGSSASAQKAARK
jgi:hypothetical protein